MPTATRPLTSLLTSVRSQIRDSRESHAAKASLERELASYHSPADLNDLHAILDRYHDRETAADPAGPGPSARGLQPPLLGPALLDPRQPRHAPRTCPSSACWPAQQRPGLNDLHAIPARYSDHETANIRRVLAGRRSLAGAARRPPAEVTAGLVPQAGIVQGRYRSSRYRSG